MRVTVINAGDLTLEDGSKLCVHANQAYDLPEKMAKAMVKGGSAYKGEPKAPEKPTPIAAKRPGTTPAEPDEGDGEAKEDTAADENKQADDETENKVAGKA
jgi:hypothetical protein